VVEVGSSDRARLDRWRRPVRGAALLSVVFWAASYSWVVGLTPPTRWLSSASPWLVMEIAAVVTGAVTATAGALLARRTGERSRRTGIRAAWVGILVVVATTASLAAPA